MKKTFLLVLIFTSASQMNAAHRKHHPKPAPKQQKFAQCGSLEHLAKIARFFTQKGIARSSENGDAAYKTQKKAVINGAKVLRALLNLLIDSQGKRINMDSPEVKRLYKELEGALECSNFERWALHGKSVLHSPKAASAWQRYGESFNELVDLFKEAIVVKN